METHHCQGHDYYYFSTIMARILQYTMFFTFLLYHVFTHS